MALAEYSFLDRVLHHLALGNRLVASAAFDIETGRTFRHSADDITNGAHVFVCGLARAGTTILMRKLHESGEFTSLTYRDMPFILAPNTWRRLSGRQPRGTVASQRAHNDGIMVSVDSPEALDEVFWRVFDAKSYRHRTHLSPHAPDSVCTAEFVDYIRAILDAETNPGRYLSKNNNNVLRIPWLRRTFPQSLILVPFRDPLHHAASLLRQHEHFTALQSKDRFAARYMSWLAHHEFGLDHRPMRLHGETSPEYPLHDPNYWLALWNHVYGWLLDTCDDAVQFVSYESLCDDPKTWEGISSMARIPGTHNGSAFVSGNRRSLPDYADDLTEKARSVQRMLDTRSCG